MGDLASKTLDVEKLLNEALRLGIGSGMAASFGKLAELEKNLPFVQIYEGQVSRIPGSKKVDAGSVFDLASLTKILATTTLAMLRYEAGQLDLKAKLSDLVPERVRLNPSLAEIEVRHLLNHSSGLPAWKPFFEELRKRYGTQLTSVAPEIRKKYFRDLVYQIRRENEVGEKIVYSDLGILIAEDFLSQNFKADLQKIWSSIPGCGLHFREVTHDADVERFQITEKGESVVMTEDCPWRGLLQGQVHDDNTWSMGGVAGHAGVFGTLSDVVLWIKAIFSGKIVSFQTLRVFFEEQCFTEATGRGLGFDRPSANGKGSTGFTFSLNSVGHLGFTGTSLWVDLDSGDYAVLLSNRVHPLRNDGRITFLRREFHALVRGN